MGNCKDCQYWTPEEPDLAWTANKGYGRCREALSDSVFSPVAAIACAEENYEAQLMYTLPDFGCVLFLQRDLV